ncbi:DUF4079 domain-containing protein [Thermoleptolyngbya sichuanensis A183]|uniref:DUF4079 domain-containing protein n=1 Tax=Thermoleptolyngbya sichuanensis A183 TaxID=2737172 RepID=A0A6M8B9Z5_9CYAN|nr:MULTISPECIES: DUF4079 domain-containing protein [Thermoleptolyngbya]MDG2615449.1 DUF4079 domain-containing protein [Thermoleptolyngbya sichuanensis XZ-Cy5]QKD82962.1 DUF4079 domain-containing protein [Thermoleptolyngbya sichuanensis A183]
MNLPSFLWLWRIAAWSMGLSLLTYSLLGISGVWMRRSRRQAFPRPGWLRSLHLALGGLLVLLVLLLLTIGLVGTLGYYGSLGHSVHLVAGLTVVALVLLSAGSAMQIGAERPWARSLHVGTNLVLFLGFIAVSLSGWSVVQKYLP